MPALKISIVRFVDDVQPGWVECRFVDAYGTEHVPTEKAPVVTEQHVTWDTAFPVPALVECVIVAPTAPGSSVRVGLEHPWGLQTDAGLSEFDVVQEQLAPRVFVSSADIDAPAALALRAALREAGCLVDHSPRQPDVGNRSAHPHLPELSG